MKPSVALETNREAIRRVVAAHHASPQRLADYLSHLLDPIDRIEYKPR